MHISSRLIDTEYAAGQVLARVRKQKRTTFDECLHLAVSMRSFRAENVSSFVKAVLDSDVRGARAAFSLLSSRYPIVRTRDLDAARAWVRQQARGSERYGLLTSSKAQRLKPHAIDVRAVVDPMSWFLSSRDDTRFRGNRWLNVKSPENQRFLVNAYRVLLTRARQGMVTFVPPGNAADHTGPPEQYDAIDRYLERVGVPAL